MKKIAFFSSSYLPSLGGVEKHLFNLISNLNNDNFHCYLFTQNKDNFEPDILVENNAFKIYRNKNYGFGWNIIHMNLFLIKNLKTLISCDVIHFHDNNTFWRWGILIYPILKIFNKKIYITFHGWEGHFPPKKTMIFLRKTALRMTDGSIAVGHYIEKWYGTKCHIITYGGVDLPVLIETNVSNNFVFIGRLSRDTGILAYLESWHRFSIKYPDYNLIICGDGELRFEVEEFLRFNNLMNVSLVGFVSNPEVYISTSLAVLTSGYLGMLESFSFKKPVIAYYDNHLKEDYL